MVDKLCFLRLCGMGGLEHCGGRVVVMGMAEEGGADSSAEEEVCWFFSFDLGMRVSGWHYLESNYPDES